MTTKLLTLIIQDGDNIYYEYYVIKNQTQQNKIISSFGEDFMRALKSWTVKGIKSNEVKMLEEFRII